MRTDERLTGMQLHVSRQVVILRERAVAFLALEWFFGTMHLLMGVQGSNRGECFATLLAIISLLAEQALRRLHHPSSRLFCRG